MIRFTEKHIQTFKEFLIEMMNQDRDNIKTNNSGKPLADMPGKNEKTMREVSVEGCELLGKGGNGAVYRLDDETIIKVYFGRQNSFDKIRKNRENTRDAFVQGVPSMIAFDMVRVGDNYGVVYEMINAKSMNQVIADNPDRIDEYACLIADTLKKLHHTEFEKGKLQDARDRWKKDVTAAKMNWATTNQGITSKQYARLWDIIVRRYFETDSPKNIQEINRILKGYSMIKFIRGIATSPSVPNFLRRPIVGITKRKLMAAVDSLYPIP